MPTVKLATTAAVCGLAALVAATAADAAVCRARLVGAGTGQGLFGAGTQNARTAATTDFEAKATKAHGKRFASLSKAASVRWDCKSGALEAKCVVTGRPCR
jgi:hypothetical protein